jgi:SAM-dependent methyltransferase
MSFYRDFAEVYERIFPVRDVTLRFVTDLIDGLSGRVLDTGCGPGHLLARLSEAGHEGTGIDLDDVMIARGRSLYPELDLQKLNMCRVGDLDHVFGAALCLGNVLPHLDRIDVSGFLGTLHHQLAPGAPWVVQSVNFDRLTGLSEWDFPPLEIDDYVFERRYIELDKPVCRFHTRLLRDGDVKFQGDVAMTPLTTAELLERHQTAGFECDSISADFAGSPFEAEKSGGKVIVFRRSSAT